MTFPTLTDRRLTQPLPQFDGERYPYPPRTGWTWINQGSATVKEDNRGHVWTQPAVASGNLIGRVRPYTGTVTVTAEFAIEGAAATFAGIGLGFRSASGQIQLVYTRQTDYAGEQWTSPTGFGSGGSIAGQQWTIAGHWVRAVDNGTNLIWSFSATGEDGSWQTVNTVARTTGLTGGPTSIGWWGRDFNGARTWVLKRWDQ